MSEDRGQVPRVSCDRPSKGQQVRRLRAEGMCQSLLISWLTKAENDFPSSTAFSLPVLWCDGLTYPIECAVLCLVTQSCPTLCDPTHYIACQAPLAMGTPQARILEWVFMPSSRGSSQSRDRTQVSHVAGGFFTVWATREAHPIEYIKGNEVGSRNLYF